MKLEPQILADQWFACSPCPESARLLFISANPLCGPVVGAMAVLTQPPAA
jgi:hypothetical protein